MNKIGQEFSVSEDMYYELVLRILNGFLSLREKEIKVLAGFLRIYSGYSSLSKEERGVLTFSKENRYRVAEECDTTYQVVNNILSRLRTKNIILGNTISEKILLPLGDTDIIFKIRIK